MVKRGKMLNSLLIFGAGGHSKVVIEAAESSFICNRIRLADENPATVGACLTDYVVNSQESVLEAGPRPNEAAIVAIGDNQARRTIARLALERGFPFANIVHPKASISSSSVIGSGVFFSVGSVINPFAEIGDHAIINTGSIVEHDCRIGNFVHVGPGVTLCGGGVVGDGTFLGAGAIVLPGVRIGCNVVVGAGVVVSRDIMDGTLVRRTSV